MNDNETVYINSKRQQSKLAHRRVHLFETVELDMNHEQAVTEIFAKYCILLQI